MHKQAWLRQHLKCLACGGALAAAGEWRCGSCGATYAVINNAVSFIDAELAAQTKVDAPNKVSDHAYNTTARAIITAVEAQGGMALDCGAGLRDFRSEHLVQVEISAYDNIDVLAVNQALPFADASFDAVISLDVLEHVSDPFASARELARVLKPGGVLFIDVPFLQVEHGYPHHYFNMTRMGMRQLFEGMLECQAHVVPRSGHPGHVVWSMLQGFRVGLPRPERAEFESLTVGELMALGPNGIRDMYENAFNEEAAWRMASTTQALFTKPWDQAANRLGLAVNELAAFRPRKAKARPAALAQRVRASPALAPLKRARLILSKMFAGARRSFRAE